MNLKRTDGQGLVETALVLPVLLLALAGAYLCCRATFLQGAAESASMTESLRFGRSLPGIEDQLAADILPDRGRIILRAGSSRGRTDFPLPIPSLAGRTMGTAEIREGWEEDGITIGLRSRQIARTFEATVDCWEKPSASGRKIRVAVGGYVATGAFR